MLIEANPSEIRAILGAMQQVITARNRLPNSEIDKKTLSGAYQYMFGKTDDLEISAFPRITPNELASALTDRELSINALRFMAVCAFVDGILNKQRIDTVLAFAKALDIREDYIAELTALAHDDLRWVMADMSRRNIESLVSTFTAGMHQREPMAGHVLPVILLWHLGLRFNEVARSGMGWLDPEKFWVAWKRGCDTKTDLFQSEWDFWAAANRPLASLRAEYAIEPLPPQFAAVDSNDR